VDVPYRGSFGGADGSFNPMSYRSGGGGGGGGGSLGGSLADSLGGGHGFGGRGAVGRGFGGGGAVGRGLGGGSGGTPYAAAAAAVASPVWADLQPFTPMVAAKAGRRPGAGAPRGRDDFGRVRS